MDALSWLASSGVRVFFLAMFDTYPL
jgi:hypothetical protein